MNVLLIANDPGAFDVESAVRCRLRAYARAIGEVHVLSHAPSGALEAREVSEVCEDTLHLYPTHAPRPLRILALAWRARAIVRAEGIEVISAQDPFEHGLVAWWAARGTKARLHIQLHTDPFAPDFANVGHPMSYINLARLFIMPFVLRRAARIRAVSFKLKRHIIGRFGISPECVSVLPIYTDLARFRAVTHTPKKGQLLWVGRLEREKDPMLALEALAAARAAGVDARLTMLGAGRLRGALATRAKVRGLEPCVDFPGHRDPLPYLARAELLLATSRYEGYGLAIVEALAAGVPVLATDVGIAREAGAIVVQREHYIQKTVELLKGGLPVPPPVADPYPSFDGYIACYVADIKATGGA